MQFLARMTFHPPHDDEPDEDQERMNTRPENECNLAMQRAYARCSRPSPMRASWILAAAMLGMFSISLPLPARAAAPLCDVTKQEAAVKEAHDAMSASGSKDDFHRLLIALVNETTAYIKCSNAYSLEGHHALAALAEEDAAVLSFEVASDEQVAGEDYTSDLVAAHTEAMDALSEANDPSVDQTSASAKEIHRLINALLDKLSYAQSTWTKP
jgi:hypothetical protein